MTAATRRVTVVGRERAARRSGRLWEIDAPRGVAIVLMVAFHLAWDLDYFGIARVDVTSGPWFAAGRASAIIFLLLAGVSLHLSATREARTSAAAFGRRQLRRGVTIFAWGLAISGVTRLAFGEGFVRFGILHLIGASIVLALPLLRLGRWNLALGAGLLAVGAAAGAVTVDTPWLVWLGLRPAGFVSVDYYPLLPWFGVVLLGLGLGGALYPAGERLVALPDVADRLPIRLLASLGRRSLTIYLLHQPVLFGLFALGVHARVWPDGLT